MAFKDFFHLSEEEFVDRISKLSDEELMKEDIHNCRTIHSGAYGAAIGALEAPMTAGVSLLGTAICFRRRHVAKRRLDLIREEIENRGLPIHTQTKRDFLIPLGIAGASLGLAGGVMDGVMHAIPVESIVDAGVDIAANTTAQMLSEVTGKQIFEMGGERMLEKSMPGTGRTKIWKQKLSTSRSASALCTTLSVAEALPPAASAPSSPVINGGPCPRLAIRAPQLELPK